MPQGGGTVRWVNWAVWRAAWLAALLSHAVWFYDRLGDDSRSPLPLGLAILFFSLKLLDVRPLRITWTRRSVLAFVVVVALLHANVIAPQADTDSNVLLLGAPTVLLVRKLLLAAAALVLVAAVLAVARQHTRCAAVNCRAAAAALASYLSATLICTSPLRAPPASV